MIDTTLSHYRITDKLGQGGMGVVYKAEDTKLDRTVAIKVLPSAALASDDDRERFYREARSAAALHHPNIATVFEIDEAVPSDAPHGTEPSPFIAMEYIDGQPLEDEVKDRPLKLERVKNLAIQIAQALEAAHDKNIVHRDVKSANVMLTTKGDAKVLDFGLAKTNQSTMLTRMGSTLGTIAYMSPEQARGEEVDKRTDLWALGVVIYEMVSGQHPFAGDYEQAVVYSIMNEDHEALTAVRSGVPMGLEWIVNKCLAKKAEDRYQSAADLIVDLRNVDISSGSGVSGVSHSSSNTILAQDHAAEQPATRPFSWAVVGGALVIGAALMFGATRLSSDSPQREPLTRVDIVLPGLQAVRFPTLSPTGEFMAVQGGDSNGRFGLYLRSMGSGEVTYVEGSDIVGDREFAFSPDGSLLAFNSGSNGGLFVAVIPAGIPRQVTDFGRFAYWKNNETVVMSDDRAGGAGGLFIVNIDGSDPVEIEVNDPNLAENYGNVLKTHVPSSDVAFGHQLIRLQGGAASLTSSGSPNIFRFNDRSGDVEVIESNALNPVYIDGGFLMYQLRADDGRLLIRAIDENTGEFAGQPTDVLPAGMMINWGEYGATSRGDLMYVKKTRFFRSSNDIWLIDLVTNEIESLGLSSTQDGMIPSGIHFSTDGKSFAFQVSPPAEGGNLYTYDLEEKTSRQFTFEGLQADPSFDPISGDLFFTIGDGNQRASIFRVPADNSRPAEHIVQDAFLPALSGDGKWMAMTGAPPTYSLDMLIMDRESGDIRVVDSAAGFPIFAHFSANSRYLVYQTNLPEQNPRIVIRSVTGNEVYELPGVAGAFPKFSPDGRYLYYLTPFTLSRIAIRTEPSFNIVGPPEVVFTLTDAAGFDINSDFTKMLVGATSVAISSGQSDEAPTIVWLQNWSEHLKQEMER